GWSVAGACSVRRCEKYTEWAAVLWWPCSGSSPSPGTGSCTCSSSADDAAQHLLLGEVGAGQHGSALGPAGLQEGGDLGAGAIRRPVQQLGHEVGRRRGAVEAVARAGAEVGVAA